MCEHLLREVFKRLNTSSEGACSHSTRERCVNVEPRALTECQCLVSAAVRPQHSVLSGGLRPPYLVRLCSVCIEHCVVCGYVLYRQYCRLSYRISVKQGYLVLVCDTQGKEIKVTEFRDAFSGNNYLTGCIWTVKSGCAGVRKSSGKRPNLTVLTGAQHRFQIYFRVWPDPRLILIRIRAV